MPTQQRFGSNNHENRKDRREPAIELDEEPAVVVREASPALQLASQDDHLMPKHCILRLKPDFDLNGEASTVRTKQISATIAPT